MDMCVCVLKCLITKVLILKPSVDFIGHFLYPADFYRMFS